MSTLLKKVELIGEEIPFLKALRQKGADAFAAAGVPTPKTEAWKYTKPNRFFEEEYVYNPRGAAETVVPKVKIPFESYKIVFENGVLQTIDETLPETVEVLPLIETLMFGAAEKVKTGALFDLEDHPFAALNTAYLNEGVCVTIKKGTKLDKPLVFVCHTTPETQKKLYNIRNLVLAESQTEAEIVEYYCCDGDIKASYFNNIVNEIYVGEGAVLKHCKIQKEAFKAAHIALQAVKVSKDGLFKSFCFQTGADLGRNETKVDLVEEGARAEVDGAYMMNGWATLDTTTNIRHLVRQTTSNQLVKGVVGGQAKGVFQGKIHIAPKAVQTQGYQLHKALVLTDEAEVDVKPELEIFADDVKCSHGAACGELDKEQLFYMQSRGIGLDEAKQILVDAYLTDVIAKVENEKISAWIKSDFMAQNDKRGQDV